MRLIDNELSEPYTIYTYRWALSWHMPTNAVAAPSVVSHACLCAPWQILPAAVA